MTQINHKKPSDLVNLKRSIILARLSSGEPVSKVSRELNLNQAHVYSWLKEGEGLRLIQTAISESNRIIESRLPDLVTKSLNEIEAQLKYPWDSGPRIAAAKVVLNLAARLAQPNKLCDACQKGNQQSTNE